MESLGCEHLIERTAEFGVAVMDEKPERLCSFVEVKGEVLRLLGNPGSVGVGGATGEMDAPCRQLDEHQNVDSFEPHGFNGEEVATPSCSKPAGLRTAATSCRPAVEPARGRGGQAAF